MALKTIVSKGKKLLKGLKGDKRTKVGKKVEAAKTKVKQAVTPKKSTVKPATIDFKKAKRTLAGTAGVGAGAGYMAGRSKSSKSSNQSDAQRAPGSSGYKPTQTNKGPNMSAVNKPKSDNKGKGYKLKKDATVRKTDREETKKKEEKFDRMAAARNQQRAAQKSMGFKKGGMVKRDGCAVRGKTRGKLI